VRTVGLILMAGAVALIVAWPNDPTGLAMLFVFAAGLGFWEAGSERVEWDDLGRGRIGR
jgi:hypothetical protein